MRQGLTTSCTLTRGVLTHQLYGPTPGKWALCSSTSGRRTCPVRRRHYPPRGRTPTRRQPPPPLCAPVQEAQPFRSRSTAPQGVTLGPRRTSHPHALQPAAIVYFTPSA